MNARMSQIAGQMVADVREWVKELLSQAVEVHDAKSAEGLERRVREEGQSLLRSLLEGLLQLALEGSGQGRRCPSCGRRRRHKGVRVRGVISALGHLRLSGPYWYCGDCRRGQHAADVLAPESASGVMRELLCLLGTSLVSFAKASGASEKLLGVRLDAGTLRRLCLREGRKVMADPPEPAKVAEGEDLMGSCDGTMVNTVQDGWRELKAYQFRHAQGRHGGAFLESSKVFGPRLRRAAERMGGAKAGRVFFVSDAADWINKQVAVQLPDAIRIVDIWHAYQHVHEAARKIFGEGTAKGRAWAKRYCEELRRYGGRAVWNSLRRVRYKDAKRQEGLEELLTYLDRQADRLDYPTYEYLDYPISNGCMESFCKQLGQRLKGPGMRWSIPNVDPMAALVSLWTQDQWDAHWQAA